jgi:hypothetical protein
VVSPRGRQGQLPRRMTDPNAMHFDEWAGIYYVIRDLGRAVLACRRDLRPCLPPLPDACVERRPSPTPLRLGARGGVRVQPCGGELVRRTALLIHLQKRTMRAPAPEVLAAERFWILANGFSVQQQVSMWSVRAARIPLGHEVVPLYWRRMRRSIRRRAARRLPPGRSRQRLRPVAARPAPDRRNHSGHDCARRPRPSCAVGCVQDERGSTTLTSRRPPVRLPSVNGASSVGTRRHCSMRRTALRASRRPGHQPVQRGELHGASLSLTDGQSGPGHRRQA